MDRLSETELVIAEKYCHGLTDKEVADQLGKPVWTIRTHKKHIHAKLGISTTHELVLYMVARKNDKDWDIKELRRQGLAAVMCILVLFHLMIFDKMEFCRISRRARVEYVTRRADNG